MTRALLMSNSANHDSGLFEHARDAIAAFFDGTHEVLFAPWALADHDGYTARVAAAFSAFGLRVRGLHSVADPAAAIRDAEALYVGGGNTFRLVATLHRRALLDPIRRAAASGLRYSGASAGSLIASPTMRTTNDMPIVQPPSFETLGLLPFQLNCHYLDADPTSTHAGETRELRLREFHEENDVPVLGLREGTWLELSETTGGTVAAVGGTAVSPYAPGPAILHRRGQDPVELAGDVSELLDRAPHFDAR
ncbi:MAG TPA: dipeptidase PepE [Gryllotalpicola sp.]